LKTSKNEVALYLINLENGGFTIVPADKRLNPILAYSDTNKMPITLDEPLPGGLKIWLNANIAAVDSVRNKKEKNNSIHKAWETLLTTESKYKSMPDPDPDPPCEDEIYEVGPLLQTTWGQDEGYNNAAPPGSCTTTTNGRVLTGCVATAIAQVMRYHESPASYNWNSMPDGAITPLNQPSGTNEIAQLMRDVGDAVNMMWGCHASGAYGTSMEPAIENVFNYSSSTDYQAFDMWDLKDDINSFPRKPALIAASDSQVGGHVWVADGSRMYYIYDSNCIANGYLSFHMNWGWEGEFNAWYQVDNFSPGNFDFDTGIYQLIGIKP
ncbi:MAG: C10 family peptidase, partial [Balneolaceae bacterium]